MEKNLRNGNYALELLQRKYNIEYNKKDILKDNVIYAIEQRNGKGKKNDWYIGQSKNNAFTRLYSHLFDNRDSIKQNMELNKCKRLKVYILAYNVKNLKEEEAKAIDKAFMEQKRLINRDFRNCIQALENLKKQGYKEENHNNRLGIVQYKAFN